MSNFVNQIGNTNPIQSNPIDSNTFTNTFYFRLKIISEKCLARALRTLRMFLTICYLSHHYHWIPFVSGRFSSYILIEQSTKCVNINCNSYGTRFFSPSLPFCSSLLSSSISSSSSLSSPLFLGHCYCTISINVS